MLAAFLFCIFDNMKRREFLKTAAAAGAGAALLGTGCAPAASSGAPRAYRVGGKARMQLSWQPYELQLQHTMKLMLPTSTLMKQKPEKRLYVMML